MSDARIHVIHENEEWVVPLRAAFEARGLPYAEWFLASGGFDLSSAPPAGVFYNRMSASAHTRGHRFGPELTTAVLDWLSLHGRRLVNGPRAVALEVSKARQYLALQAAGIATPRTLLAVGEAELERAARSFGAEPLILKPNRGGRGQGVQLFGSAAELLETYRGGGLEAPLDGCWLLQEYLRAERPVITRAEFVGGRFLYAVEVDASRGFELCPADQCQLPEEEAFCPAGAQTAGRFRILPRGIEPALAAAYERFLAANEIEVAGIEFIRDASGRTFTYDINTNTNYNAEAEAADGVTGSDGAGMGAVAAFLGRELRRTEEQRSAA